MFTFLIAFIIFILLLSIVSTIVFLLWLVILPIVFISAIITVFMKIIRRLNKKGVSDNEIHNN